MNQSAPTIPIDPFPPDVLSFVQEKAPWFTKAVQAAGEEPVTRLEAFGDDMALLYACLWYAHDQGVPVRFEAPPRNRNTKGKAVGA